MILRLTILVLSLAAAISATIQYREFEREIATVEATMENYHIGERRPEYADLVDLSHGLGRSAQYIVDASLRDALQPVRLANADRETQELWMDAMRSLPEQLADTESILLDALEVRPGWNRHLSLVGEVEYVQAARGRETTLERWRQPLLLGARGEGGTRAAWRFLGTAYLGMWESLPEDELRIASEALAQALHDSAFVRSSFSRAHEVLGADVFPLIPDDPAALQTAMNMRDAELTPHETWELYERWVDAEWNARETDLARIRESLALRNIDRADLEARQWLANHPFDEFDTPAGLKQLSEVVNAVVHGSPEQWGRGRQTQLVIFLLDPWRQQHIDMTGVWRIAETISGTPDPILARARLAAGKRSAATRLATESDTAGSLEWTDTYLALARHHLAQNELAQAADVLDRLSPAALNQCEVLETRRDLAEAKGDRETAESLTAGLAAVSVRGLTTQTRGGRATLPVCLSSSTLQPTVVEVTTEEPTLIEIGWDGGRIESRMVDGTTSFPLPPRPGSHLATLRTPLARSIPSTLTLPK